MKVSMTKRSSTAATPKKATKSASASPLVSFNLQDNGDDTLTVLGVDAAGNSLDISGVATLNISSSDTSLLTVDTPVGMTSAMHAQGKVGSCELTATATWNDGSIGPFSFVLPITLTTGGPTGIQIVPGTPTVH